MVINPQTALTMTLRTGWIVYWAEFIGGWHTEITFAYPRQIHDGLCNIDFQHNMLEKAKFGK